MAEKHTELLPCPFCGSANVDPLGWASKESAGPACDDCGASAGGINGTPEQNVAAWNCRSPLIAQAPAMLRELERMVEHFSVFASDHSMDASTETWAALHCAKEVIRSATGRETMHSAPSPSDVFAAWLNEGPKLAAAAGCYVGIKVSAATGEAP